ncbi:hypothetical protein [Anaeroselena agilis]|uniref:Holin n=1 Tax=Anaeroselena agilis TaxID=3063788 RepID=A0ABU3NVK8_9FIRM|nr:hypothetical protein [Selenomonadales bacterium 4137-cl]
MKKDVKRFFVGLLYENNEPSLTRVLFAASFLLVAAAMVYDWVYGWPPFLDFAKQVLTLILGAKTADKVATYITNSYKNSPPGEAPRVPKNPEGGC